MFGSRYALFKTLHVSLAAGLNLAQAMALAAKESDITAISCMAKSLKRGLSLVVSDNSCHLFEDWERALIASAEASGKLEQVFRHLEGFHLSAYKRAQKFKKSVLPPVLLLLTMILLSNLPALAKGVIGIGSFIEVLLFKLALLYLTLYLGRRLYGNFYKRAIQDALYRLPGWRRVVWDWAEARVLFSLAVQYEAGVDWAQACALTAKQEPLSEMNTCLAQAQIELQQGESFSSVLPLIVHNAAQRELLAVAEQSGALIDSLRRASDMASTTQQNRMSFWADNLPRGLYIFILLAALFHYARVLF